MPLQPLEAMATTTTTAATGTLGGRQGLLHQDTRPRRSEGCKMSRYSFFNLNDVKKYL